jgi:3-hydroxyisobutyrate dehydrogenase-like beta-hydroxyacid dehydrogenase
MATVAVIGLGNMGSTLARVLSSAGHDVTAWTRSPERREAYAATGGTTAETPAAACRAGELVVACVSDYDATRAVLTEAGADALEGRTLVQLASGGPADARSLAVWLEGYGVDYIDGAILTFPARIGDEPTMIAYSGSRAGFDRHRDTLLALGRRSAFVADDVGGAAAVDLAWLSFYYGASMGLLQGVAFCEAEGVDPGKAFDAVPSLLVEIAAEAEYYRGLIARRDYRGDQAAIDTHLAAIHHIVDAAETSGVNAAFPRLVRDVYEKAVAGGHGGEEAAATIEVLRQPG